MPVRGEPIITAGYTREHRKRFRPDAPCYPP
jgi:hypothetical protein